MEPQTESQLAVVNMTVDLDSVLPHSEERRGRPLQAEERRLGEALSDLVAFSPPATELRVGLVGVLLLPQLHQHLVDGPAAALRGGEVLGEGDGLLASTAEHRGETGQEDEGELGGEETNVSSITQQSHLLRSVRTEEIIVELLTERQQSALITARKQQTFILSNKYRKQS